MAAPKLIKWLYKGNLPRCCGLWTLEVLRAAIYNRKKQEKFFQY